MRAWWCVVVLMVMAGAVPAQGLLDYTDAGRGIAFSMPPGFVENTRGHAIDDPPYVAAFDGPSGKVQIRLQVDTANGEVGPQQLLVMAHTYAMNRYGQKQPHDVFLAQGPSIPGAKAMCSVVGSLPRGNRWQAEKALFIAAGPSRIYTVTFLFQDGDLPGALKAVDTLLSSVHLLPLASR